MPIEPRRAVIQTCVRAASCLQVQRAELDDAAAQLQQVKTELLRANYEVHVEKAHAATLLTEKGKANKRAHDLRNQIADSSEQMRKEVEDVKKQAWRAFHPRRSPCLLRCEMLVDASFVQMSGWLEHEKRLRLDAEQRADDLLHEVRPAFGVTKARGI